jgi:FKBP-type peptidyl-prolyl cis-trans isomerase
MRPALVIFLLLLSACAPARAPVAEVTIPEAAPAAPVVDAPVPRPAAVRRSAVTVTETGLTIEDLRVGTGAEAKAGDTVTVHYVGTLPDGAKFDSSRDRGTPFEFKLGAGQVLKGWDEGVVGMKIGGLRRLTIPPRLGYGARGAAGVIPSNATLVFEVELLEVR